jgi:hypothetical protein
MLRWLLDWARTGYGWAAEIARAAIPALDDRDEDDLAVAWDAACAPAGRP